MEKDLKMIIRHNVRSSSELGDLTYKIHEVVKSAFGRQDFDLSITKDHLKGDVVMAAVCGDEVIAFNTIVFGCPRDVLEDISLSDTKGCYFAAAAVSDSYQGIGVYQTMNSLRFDVAIKSGVSLIYTRTQNPLVETALTHYLKRLKDDNSIQNFNLERIKIESCYGQRLTGYETPKSKDEDIQSAYDKLNATRGDAYLLLFSLKR